MNLGSMGSMTSTTSPLFHFLSITAKPFIISGKAFLPFNLISTSSFAGVIYLYRPPAMGSLPVQPGTRILSLKELPSLSGSTLIVTAPFHGKSVVCLMKTSPPSVVSRASEPMKRLTFTPSPDSDQIYCFMAGMKRATLTGQHEQSNHPARSKLPSDSSGLG